MKTFENKKLIAFTDEELDSLLACINAAAVIWRERAQKGHIGAKECAEMADEYWRKLYKIQVGK